MILEALALAMKVNDASILEAFGYDQSQEQGTTIPTATIRPGPLPNFFVVYGLAFETISRSFGNPAARQESIAATKALQTLVKPIYSGAALFSSSIFDELCTLCYRVAIGEGATLRTEMVQIMSNFASSRGPAGDQDHIRRVVAVVAYALRVSIGTADAQSNCKPSCVGVCREGLLIALEISLVPVRRQSYHPTALRIGHRRCRLDSSLSLRPSVPWMRGLVSMLSSLVYSCTLVSLERITRHFDLAHSAYAGVDLLRDESNEQDVAGPTLPAFKSLLDAGYMYSPDQETLGKAIHGILSAALSNLDDVRRVILGSRPLKFVLILDVVHAEVVKASRPPSNRRTTCCSWSSFSPTLAPRSGSVKTL